MYKYSNKAALKKACKTGFKVAFTPGFVAALVSYLVPDTLVVHNSDYLGYAVQMILTIGASLAWATIASAIVGCVAFAWYKIWYM